MKLEKLINDFIIGELEHQGYTLEKLLEIDLLSCDTRTLNELNDLFYRLAKAFDDISSYWDDSDN